MDGIPVYERVSIPSRRVGDPPTQKPIKHQAKFPSPQGGSETPTMQKWSASPTGFHPLKAGRRPGYDSLECLRRIVSIPSRRVGDLRRSFMSPLSGGEFPSPQGGSETMMNVFSPLPVTSFHPLKAGRRLQWEELEGAIAQCFHPLKAGRRPTCPRCRHSLFERFHPLKAGRRLAELNDELAGKLSFHPLKAGRRLPGSRGHRAGTEGFHPLKAGRRLIPI